MAETRLASRHKAALQKLKERKQDITEGIVPGMSLMDMNALAQKQQKSESLQREQDAKSRLSKRRGSLGFGDKFSRKVNKEEADRKLKEKADREAAAATIPIQPAQPARRRSFLKLKSLQPASTETPSSGTEAEDIVAAAAAAAATVSSEDPPVNTVADTAPSKTPPPLPPAPPAARGTPPPLPKMPPPVPSPPSAPPPVPTHPPNPTTSAATQPVPSDSQAAKPATEAQSVVDNGIEAKPKEVADTVEVAVVVQADTPEVPVHSVPVHGDTQGDALNHTAPSTEGCHETDSLPETSTLKKDTIAKEEVPTDSIDVANTDGPVNTEPEGVSTPHEDTVNTQTEPPSQEEDQPCDGAKEESESGESDEDTPEWFEGWDADRELFYYFNATTGKSSWEKPTAPFVPHAGESEEESEEEESEEEDDDDSQESEEGENDGFSWIPPRVDERQCRTLVGELLFNDDEFKARAQPTAEVPIPSLSRDHLMAMAKEQLLFEVDEDRFRALSSRRADGNPNMPLVIHTVDDFADVFLQLMFDKSKFMSMASLRRGSCVEY